MVGKFETAIKSFGGNKFNIRGNYKPIDDIML